MESTKRDVYSFSRLMYIIEAALEYFISIAVSTIYLARITAYIGISDSLTGILSSFVSLGCGFQLVAIFLFNKRPVKRWVTVMHMISQTLFALIYIVPIFKFSVLVKTVIFFIMLLCAQIIHNIINSPKINWYMSLVDNGNRGSFTANKEIISLLGGIVFSFGLGMIMDYYTNRGDIQIAFILCGICLFCMMALHSLTLILSKEKPVQKKHIIPVKEQIASLLKDKNIFKMIGIAVLWSIANYATLSFTGSYQAKELGFSSTFSSVIIITGSLFRILFSRPMGKFADKHSFTNMLYICFSIAAIAYGFNFFTVPSNGKVFYSIYHILYCIAMAGINSAMINLIYDYVDCDKRISALALKQSLSGFAGFFTTLILSRLLNRIQRNGNKFLGISIYAQQVMSGISFIVTIFLILYMLKVVNKKTISNK